MQGTVTLLVMHSKRKIWVCYKTELKLHFILFIIVIITTKNDYFNSDVSTQHE